MPRRTKIIATLGPATDNENMIEALIHAGMNIVRVNFSHGRYEEQAKRIRMVREMAAKLKREIGILVDLQGPKIRIAGFKNKKVMLKNGQTFILDAALAKDAGDETQVGIDYPELVNDVRQGHVLILGDGLLELGVQEVIGTKIVTEVLQGGELSNHKGINLRGGGLSAKALTEKDKEDLVFAATLDVDYFAFSFVRGEHDMIEARELVEKANSKAGIIAKIERQEAIKHIDSIIQASDGVMVARGDLGIEIGFAELPAVQKHIIQRARALNKAVITATQMMETMIHNPIPTRAEVFDVANAVLDGTDAVMLSAETAVGAFPTRVVSVMHDVCLAAESQRSMKTSGHRVECHFERVDESIAMGAMYIANHLDIQAIIALTESGSTPLWMSRIRSGIPIFGLSRHPRSRGRMTLYRGVYPVHFDVTQVKEEDVISEAIETMKAQGLLQVGARVVVTKGDVLGVDGGSNSLKIVTVS